MKKESIMASMPIPKLLLKMAIPLIISMLVQALYNIFDSMFVSFVNDNKISFNAITLANSIQLLMIALGTGLGVGMNALLSKSLGEKNFERVNKSAWGGIIIAFCSWLIFIILGLSIPKAFLSTQTSNVDVINAGAKYLRITMCGSIFIFLQFVFERMLQGTGRAKLSMVSQVSGALTNIILDPIFIFVLDLGVEGAAYATIIGQFIGAFLGLLFNVFLNPDIALINNSHKRCDIKTIINILEVGIPSTIMVAIGSLLTFSLMAILNGFSSIEGEEAVKHAQNAYGAYSRLQSFVFMPVFGLNNALVPIVAYNYGAKNKQNMDKAVRLSLLSAVIIMLIGTLIFEIFPIALLKIFNSEGDMFVYGMKVLRIIGICFVFAAIGIVISSYFQAISKGFISMIISFVRQLVILLPAAYLLSFTGKINSIWWAFPIAELGGCGLSIVLYYIYDKKIKEKFNKIAKV